MNRTALLLMDLMQTVVPTFGGDEALLARLRGATAAARAADVMVIHVRVMFREGYPEVSPSNRTFSALARHFDFTERNPAIGLHAGVDVEPGDIHVTKRRISAFSGSDLDLVLRSRGIDRLVLGGVATSGVVLSTLREAADKDYRLCVLADGCADRDPELHRVLTEKLFPTQAEVISVADWIETLPR